MPQERVWSDMGTTHLLVMCQASDKPVKNVVGQRPQREVSHDGLHHSLLLLRAYIGCFVSKMTVIQSLQG